MQRYWLAALVCLLIGAGACRTRTEEPLTQVIRSPGLDPDTLGAVAYLGFAAGTSGETARTTMEDIVERRLLATPTAFVIMRRDEIARRANADNAGPLLAEVRDFWRGSGKFDKFKLADLCAALGVRAVLVGMIEDWVEAGSAKGSSDVPYSKVAATLELYSADTGRRLWKARSSQSAQTQALEGSLEAEHATTVQGRERMRSQTVQATQRGQEAPAIEGVAEQVAAALEKALREI